MPVRSHIALLCCALATASPLALAQAKSARRTTAEALKQKGLELVKHADIDIDGDGRKELFCVGRDKEGLRLVLVGEASDGAVVTQVLPPAKGKDIASFLGKQLIPPSSSQQVVLEVYDDNPDEKVKRVRIYGMRDGVVKEIFTSVLRRSKNAAERPSWETDASIVQYGDARGGWFFLDNEEDGISEIYVRKKPQIIEIDGKDGPVKLLTGVREQVWRWDAGLFAYAERGEELNNFLPALAIAKVTASSAWIPPDELRELKQQALSDALMKKAGSEGAAGGEFDFGLEDLEQSAAPKPKAKPGPKPKSAAPKAKPEPEAEIEIEIDRTPYMRHAADKNLATAWIEDAAGNGRGEWLQLELEEEAPIHMVRVVAGCVDTQQSFRSHNVPESFKIQLDAGSEALVNRREPTVFERPVIAFSDQIVKLTSRPWAKTTLIFFDGKREAKRVKITLDKAIKQGRGDHTCISEVSIH
jgi:hypothetical protein